jgi:glycosyltransferase involved in cell wall biosynthesis
MKILVVSHYYAAHGGGIESVIRQLLLAFREVAPQHRFTWAATACDVPAELPGVTNLPMAGNNQIEKKHGVPLPLWSWSAWRQLAAAVKTHDAIWLHDTLYLGNIVAYWLARRAGKPVLITQHIGAVPYQNKWLRRAVDYALRYVTQPMLHHAFRTVFIAAQVRSFFMAQGEKWFASPLLIPNGVLHSVYKTVGYERRSLLREKYLLGEAFTVLFVGRFVEKKGMNILRLLAQQLPDVHFLFAGKGSIDPAAWNLPNCRVARDRTGAAIAELYQAADLLVLPSCGEGLPLVIQEAASCGLPILCATETAMADSKLPQMVNTAAVQLEDPVTTTKDWSAAIRALQADPALRQLQGAALANYARDTWSWQMAVLNYDAIFATMPQPIIPMPMMDDDA